MKLTTKTTTGLTWALKLVSIFAVTILGLNHLLGQRTNSDLPPKEEILSVIQFAKAWVQVQQGFPDGRIATAEELGGSVQAKLEPLLRETGLQVASYGAYGTTYGVCPKGTMPSLQ